MVQLEQRQQLLRDFVVIHVKVLEVGQIMWCID
jgi:hypothetical protein